MNANMMNNAQQLIENINGEGKNIKYIKKEKGLLERHQTDEKIILAEDNRQILLG